MIYAFVAGAIALTVPGFVLAVRALPWVRVRVLAGTKPWSCDVCMCFWSTALFAVIAASSLGDARAAVCAGPAYTVALLLLAKLQAPPEGAAFPAEPPAEDALSERLEP